MPKPTVKQKARKLSKKRIAVAISATIILLLLILVGIIGYNSYRQYSYAIAQASMDPTRELVVSAVKGLKSDAPRDARTGDIYFPEAKLYLPAPAETTNLTYSFEKVTNELSISNAALTNQNIAALYAAVDTEALFAAVPKLQACSRGITITVDTMTNTSQAAVQRSVDLAGGKTAYIALDSGCPELGSTVELLGNLRSY